MMKRTKDQLMQIEAEQKNVVENKSITVMEKAISTDTW